MRTNRILIAVSLVFWIGAFYGGWQMAAKFTAVPQIRKIVPNQGETINPLAPDMHIYFDAPVRAGALQVHSFPEIDFTVQASGMTHIILSPKTTIPTGEHYMVYLANIEGPFTRGYGGEQLLEIMTPETAVTEIVPGDNAQNIPDTQSFIIRATTEVDPQEWSVKIEPPVAMIITKDGPKTLRMTPNEPFRQSTSYTMTVFHTPTMVDRLTRVSVKQLDQNKKMTIRFSTARAAFVSALLPEGNVVRPDADIRITFEEPMDKTAVMNHLSITPSVAVYPVWSDGDKTLSLSHDTLVKDTDYTVKLSRGLTTAKGGRLEKDVEFHFHTAGPLRVTNFSATASAQLTFDQDIAASVVNHLSVRPEVAGKTVAKDNTLTFIPDTSFLPETAYTVTLTRGAESVFGLPTAVDQTFTFTTPPNQILLSVPFYKQQSWFTCNISAARMLLAFRGTEVSEADLIHAIGLGGKRGTGNPYKGYIDDYGTYWDAIARGVSTYRATRLITSGKLSDIIAEVKKGNPVMTWGQNGWSDPHDISWTSTDGTFIKAVNGMHSAVVRGYWGPDANPTKIFLNDPWRGQYEIATSEFMRRWGYYGMAMVVE